MQADTDVLMLLHYLSVPRYLAKISQVGTQVLSGYWMSDAQHSQAVTIRKKCGSRLRT